MDSKKPPIKENLIRLTNDKPYSLISKGISRNIVQSIMGGSIPSVDKMYEVAKALNVQMEELLGVPPIIPPAYPADIRGVLDKAAFILKHGGKAAGYLEGIIDLKYQECQESTAKYAAEDSASYKARKKGA